ncbi:gastrula zinc finger protein XlCGF26.1-like [Bacillus rossius redtenbacheri]|uniref:gastrula zinc finger protein XlCGF26.1-like n=1 Tax=Bacillus rossius redtenbacheri TaxID=93214 RepID=UPI002FDCFAA2
MEVQALLSNVEIIDAEVFKYEMNEFYAGASCLPTAACNNTTALPEDEQEVELDEVISKQDIVKVDREPSLLLYVKPDRTRKANRRKCSLTSCACQKSFATPKLQEAMAYSSAESPSKRLTTSLRSVKKLKLVNKVAEKFKIADPKEIREDILNVSKDGVEVQELLVENEKDSGVENKFVDDGSVWGCRETAETSDDGGGNSRSSYFEPDSDYNKTGNKGHLKPDGGGVNDNLEEDKNVVKYNECIKESKNHICEICAAAFMQRSHLATHMRRHNTERRFKCHECGSFFKTKSSVYFHMKCHLEAPFVCKICSKEYPERKKLMRHVRIIHASLDLYPCKKCGKTFKTRQKYELHLTLHTGLKPFACDLCQKTFVYKSTYVQHMHSHELHKAFKCDLCPKEYAICADFKKHYRNHSENRPFQCPFCTKSFTLKSTLKNHVRTHEPEKPFKCKLCEKSFMKKESYECHMMVHKGEKPKYLCDQCSMSYYNIFALKRHYVKHTGERKFSCTVCSRAFWMKDALNVHMRVHSSVKLFPCSQCPKTFSHKHTLESHLRTHQNTVPNVCPFCQKTFVHKAYFCRHVQLHENKGS